MYPKSHAEVPRHQCLLPLRWTRLALMIALSLPLLSPTYALAQTVQPTSSPPNANAHVQQAHNFYEEGRKALDTGDLAKARDLLTRSFLLNPTWECASDLGVTELNLKQYREAAAHLEYFLTNADARAVTAGIRKDFEAYLNEAKSQLTTFTIIVNEPGAIISIDNQFVSRSPILNVIYETPEPHTIRAHKTGFLFDESKIKGEKGSHVRVELTLKPTPASREPPKSQPFSMLPLQPDRPIPYTPPQLNVGIPTWVPAFTGVLSGVGFGVGVSFMATTSSHERGMSEDFAVYGGFGMGGTLLTITIVLVTLTSSRSPTASFSVPPKPNSSSGGIIRDMFF